MIPFTDDPILVDQHRTDHRIGRHMPRTQTSQLKTTVHVCFVRGQECEYRYFYGWIFHRHKKGSQLHSKDIMEAAKER